MPEADKLDAPRRMIIKNNSKDYIIKNDSELVITCLMILIKNDSELVITCLMILIKNDSELVIICLMILIMLVFINTDTESFRTSNLMQPFLH